MYGPKPPGFWSKSSTKQFQHLIAGRSYQVIKEFTDYDRVLHLVGEEWTFLGSSYLPYESGLSLFVSLDSSNEWHIRLQWIPEEQGEIIDKLHEFIRANQ